MQKVPLGSSLPLQHWYELTAVAEQVHIKVRLLFSLILPGFCLWVSGVLVDPPVVSTFTFLNVVLHNQSISTLHVKVCHSLVVSCCFDG